MQVCLQSEMHGRRLPKIKWVTRDCTEQNMMIRGRGEGVMTLFTRGEFWSIDPVWGSEDGTGTFKNKEKNLCAKGG